MSGGVKQGLFLRIEDFARRRYRTVFLVTLLLVVVSLLLGTQLELDGDFLNLVPKHNRAVNTFKEALQDFGSLDYLLVLVEARPGQGAEELQDFADLLAENLRSLPSIEYVEHKIDTSGPFFEFFRRNQILFLPPDRVGELSARLTDDAIAAQVQENLRQLTGPSSFFMKQLLEQDPFQISPLLFEVALRNRGPLQVDLNSGYFLSRDGTALLLIAKPVKPAQDVAFVKVVAAEAEAAAGRTAAEFLDDLGAADDGEATPAPLVSYGGTYIVALDDSTLIMQDMARNGILSFLFIVILYYFCYRRFGALLYSTLPLIVGQCLTLGVAYIFLRRLNSATTGFTAMLMGLGTDFTIVMYARYVEERQRGRTVAEALRLMMGVSAFGVFTGAITSAGTFYAMCVTEYKGLWDFGFLVGSGILLCLVAILFLLPALISFNEGRRPTVTKRLYLHSFGIEGVMTWSTRHPWPVLAATLLLTVVGGWLAWNVEFSDNVQDLRSSRNRGVLMQERIAATFDATFNPMMVLCRAGDVDTMMQRNREANDTLERFVEDGTLLGYDSIFSYLPAPREQEEVIRLLRAGAGGAFDTARIERTFRQALRDQGFREDFYDTYLQALPATLNPERPVSLADLQHAGLQRFIDRYVKQDADGSYTSVTYMFPADASAKRHAPPQLVQALDRPEAGVEVTGVNLASAELRNIFKHDARLAVIVGIVLVAVLLWLDFRSLWLMVLANIQLLTGVIWMLAMMTILDIKMNFVNAFVTTMILGVGIDYGIHIIHRISQEGLTNPTGLLETGKAVVMAAMTNIAGFGTLALSNYPGLRSMGLVSAIGSFTCLVTALTTLPALMILTRTRVEPKRS
jgi:hypothetical protein